MAAPAKPKAIKPFKVVKPKKSKRRSTVTTKHHRYQSFSERIAKFKIDPIRRRRNAEGREELADETETYFGRSLIEWRDLNLSNTFTGFASDVGAYCDSLPVVLHNEDRIMDLLIAYLEKADELAMEPLLNLFSHFAHDLDARFEKHFQRAVGTIAEVASKHQDPAVVEWSFTCLAWLFKYLSRLLAPDLRPLYNLMSPYLGKEVQKPFIIRFAAESLSFLLRKAAATYERDQEPLDRIISHMVQDCVESRDERSADLHRQGIMTLLTEAIKGVQTGLHSSGLATVQSLLKSAGKVSGDGKEVATEMVVGVLTSLIHHTNRESFQPVAQTVVEYVQTHLVDQEQPLQFASSVLFTVVSVRKGTRITEWKPIISVVGSLIKQASRSQNLVDASAYHILSVTAVAMQSATIDAVLPALGLLETLRRDFWTSHFLRFCDFSARMGRERFQNFLLPQLQKFIVEHWEEHGESLCLLLPRLTNYGLDLKVTPPSKMQDTLSERLTSLGDLATLSADTEAVKLAEANATLLALPYLKLGDPHREKLQSSLLAVVRASLDPSMKTSRGFRNFALGACLQPLLNLTDKYNEIASLWPALCSATTELGTSARFWSSLLHYIRVCKPDDLNGSQVNDLRRSLVQALASPSHGVRQSALEMMEFLYELQELPTPNVLATASTIESTPVSLETSRGISMNIRNLVAGYADASADPLLRQALPTYCFGLLHLKLAQAWEDAISALAEMCRTSSGEETVINTAQAWLDGVPEADDRNETDPILTADSQGFVVVSDFQCSNYMRVAAMSKQVFEEPSGGYPTAEQQLQLDIKLASTISLDSRGQALRVLNKIPHIAEKRSRILVPVLLKWAGAADAGEDEQSVQQVRWSRKDQKAMLGIFAQFVNPRVLYRSSEVYDALLRLSANGDVEIQQSALKAIFAWKDPAVSRYEVHLVNLLDEARFREELSVFLQQGDEEEAVRSEDERRLLPVLLRLLYGRAVAGGKHVQGSRRKAIFVALSRFKQDALGMFINIAMGAVSGFQGAGDLSTPLSTPARQQFGMLNMLNDLLETLGSSLEPFATNILHGVVRCTAHASKQLEHVSQDDELEDLSLLRSVRQVGFQCLVHIFTSMRQSDFADEADYIVRELVQPRLQKFAAENAQSVSGMLRLFAAWSSSTRTSSYLANPQGPSIAAVAELLRQPSAKDEVRLFALQEILDRLLEDGQGEAVIRPHMSAFTTSIGFLLNQQVSKDVLNACVRSIAQLAEHITDAGEAKSIINVCSGLLVKRTKIVSPPTKTGLLRTISPLLEVVETGPDSPLFEAVCGLFSRLAEPNSRILLSEVLSKLCKADLAMSKTAEICRKLNCYSGLSNEPEHEQREQGFTSVYEHWTELSAQQWSPIVHNCMFFIRDTEDVVNRSSAAQTLEHLIDAASDRPESLLPLLSKTLLPGIERGMLQSYELVRAEYLRLLGHVVEKLPNWSAVSDMTPLTVGGDDEASFFVNVLHIQQHRRLRALRRLAEDAAQVNSSNVTKIFLPLLEHFVFDQAPGDAGRTLADQTIVTIGALANCLSWSAFRATFKRYISYIKTKEDIEKTVLRLLGALVDALAASPRDTLVVHGNEAVSNKSEVIVRDFLPPLMEYLHHRDESTVDRRMPVAVTIVKLLLVLPEAELSIRLAAVLTDVSHILRSRSQEARDQTRKAIQAILSLVGPSYLGFIIKELRSALQRGYQLHVLSFTVHSLLVSATEGCQPGDLNHCLPDMTAIIMDDIFGITGQEKDAEEYKSGMKEVKSSKSYDTMELLARVTPINKLGLLVQPLRALLTEKLDAKAVKKVDELLVRLRKGVDQNPAADNRDMLIFCHEIVRQVYAEQTAPSANGRVQDYRIRKFLIQMESANKSKARGATSSHMFKLVSFALNLVRRVCRRHEDLQTPANMAGFLPMAGDALVQGQEEVKLAAIKLLATIIRVPLAELDSNAPVYLKEAVGLVKAAPSMTSDSSKAALELVTAVLREKRSVTVKEADIAHVLKALRTDIDEPDRQGIIYKFLRAVLGRKIVITEVYEVMDEAGKVMVTNPDRSVRESARSAYLQFVLDYPQGKDRWNKQAAFMVENLRYQHPAGRQSVMELLHGLLSKLSDDVLAQLAFTFFVALVPVRISDADPACRQMAGILIAKLFERAADEQLKSFMSLMDKWLGNEKKPMIQVAALQCWASYLRTRDVLTKQQQELRERIAQLLTGEDVAIGEQVTQAVLDTFAVMIDVAADTAFAAASVGIWDSIQPCLQALNVDIQETAAKLVGAYYSHLASSASKADEGLAALPLQGSGGLQLDADGMRQLCHKSLRVLMASTRESGETLMAQTVRNVAFLGRCFAANEMLWRTEQIEELEDNDEVQEEEDAKVQKRGSSALAYLLNRLSYIIRQDTLSRTARAAALQCQAILINQLQSIPNLQSVLRPLYTLTDPSIPQSPIEAHRILVDKARELLELLQKKVGTEAYVAALSETRKEARAKREERRQKRKIGAVSAPEKWAKEKKRKHEMQRVKKKEQNAEMRGRRRGW